MADAGRPESGQGDSLARLSGFLTALGAVLFLLVMMAVGWMHSALYGDGLELGLFWMVVVTVSPLAIVGTYAFGWLRDWPVPLCLARSLGAATVLAATVIVAIVASY